MALVLDTGVLLGALNDRDRDHEACLELLSRDQEEQVIPAPVLVELDQLLGRLGGLKSWLGLCAEIVQGRYQVFQASPAVIEAAARLQARFQDQPIGFVDASVFVTCEQLGEDRLATLDHRHFSILRTKDGKALRLVP